MLDPRIRDDFPLLKREVHGKRLVYLDNAATTQKPKCVIDALVRYYTEVNANVHRGIHLLAEQATQEYEQVREATARFIHAESCRTIVFTRNATEAINLVAHGWGRKALKPDDEIVLTEMEHHSNLVPWQMIAQATGAKLVFIPITDDGQLRLERLPDLVSPQTRLISLTQMSNVLGTINPVQQVVQFAHERGILVMVDGAQGVPHLGIDVRQVGCDFLAFSAHKMLGPMGVGILYGKEARLEEMDPLLGGGEMIREVYLDHATWNDLPWRYEAGTPNVGDVIAFGAALQYLERIGMDEIRAHELELIRYALEKLRRVPGLTLYGPMEPEARGGVISFNLADLHPHDLGTALDYEGIAIRGGHHCAQPLMRRLGVVATARVSFYLYNTKAEIDRLVEALNKARAFFNHVTRPT